MHPPIVIAFCSRNPFGLNKEDNFRVKKDKIQKNKIAHMVMILAKPCSVEDMVNAATRELGREDCGYTHECKTCRLSTTWFVEVKPDEQLIFWQNWATTLQEPRVINL